MATRFLLQADVDRYGKAMAELPEKHKWQLAAYGTGMLNCGYFSGTGPRKFHSAINLPEDWMGEFASYHPTGTALFDGIMATYRQTVADKRRAKLAIADEVLRRDQGHHMRTVGEIATQMHSDRHTKAREKHFAVAGALHRFLDTPSRIHNQIGEAGAVPEFRYRRERFFVTGRGPYGKMDHLDICVPRDTTMVVKGNLVTIGVWEWRKGSGHSLAVRYNGTRDKAVRDFVNTHNQEQRRAILARHGDLIESFQYDANATDAEAMKHQVGEDKVQLAAHKLQADDFGQLWKLEMHRVGDIAIPSHMANFRRSTGANYWGQHFTMVRVVCPTTQAVYWLNVPDRTTTAHAACAITFGLTVEEYAPAKQA
jgi:hypothetical protein